MQKLFTEMSRKSVMAFDSSLDHEGLYTGDQIHDQGFLINGSKWGRPGYLTLCQPEKRRVTKA